MVLSEILAWAPLASSVEIFRSEVPFLVAYAVAMAIYGIFVWHFYRQLASRDIISFDISELKSRRKHRFVREVLGFMLYVIKYAVLFPLFSFFWFAMLSVFLFFLSKSQSVEVIMVIAITIVSATRMLAYYNEDISKDVAKLIPFTLLGVFLVDPAFLSLSVLEARFMHVFSLVHIVAGYLIFVVVLEMVLRLAFEIKDLVFSTQIKEEEIQE